MSKLGGGIGGGDSCGDGGGDLAVIVAEVVRAGRFVSGEIRALLLWLTPNPYSTTDDSWNKKHDNDGVNGAGEEKDRE